MYLRYKTTKNCRKLIKIKIFKIKAAGVVNNPSSD